MTWQQFCMNFLTICMFCDWYIFRFIFTKWLKVWLIQIRKYVIDRSWFDCIAIHFCKSSFKSILFLFLRSSLAYLPGSVHGGSMTNSSSSSLPSITTLNNANVFVKQEPTDADQLLKRQQHHMQQQQQQQQQHNTGKISTCPFTLT